MSPEERVLQEIDRRSLQSQERVRQLCYEKGRPDIVAQFDAQMKDIRLGIYGARATWHALSEAQRRALRFANSMGQLVRIGPQRYATSPLIKLATARNLIARELLACNGGAFDPERVLVLTERGRFVLKHGTSALEAEAKKKGRGK